MNRLGLLFGALVVVLLVAWLSGVFDSEFSTVSVPEWEVDRDTIEELSLRSSTDTVVLSRSGDVWRLKRPLDAKVDSAKVARLLEDLEDFGFGSVVSTNPERYGRYGVDSTGPSILIRSDDSEETLVVGKSGADFETVYVRVEGDDRVYASRGRLSVETDANSWRDRTIVAVPRQAVVSIAVEAQDGSLAVSRSSGSWIVEDDGQKVEADSNAVDRWVRRFAPLKGNRFVSSQEFDEATPFARITFETLGGSTVGIDLREGENELLALGPGVDGVLTVSKGMKGSLVPDIASLRRLQ